MTHRLSLGDPNGDWDSARAFEKCLADIGGCKGRAFKLSPEKLARVAERMMQAGAEMAEQAGLEIDGDLSISDPKFGSTLERKVRHYENDIQALKGIIGNRGDIIKDLKHRKAEWKRRAKDLGYVPAPPTEEASE